MIDSAKICGNVHRKSGRKRNDTLIRRFCLDLDIFPLVSPLYSLPCQVEERAKQKHQDEPATWAFKKNR